jgi:hypothetical protein
MSDDLDDLERRGDWGRTARQRGGAAALRNSLLARRAAQLEAEIPDGAVFEFRGRKATRRRGITLPLVSILL